MRGCCSGRVTVFEDKKFVCRFKDYLLGLPVTKKQVHIRFFAKNKDEILAADTIEKLFSILRHHCNYRNYEIILHIVKRFWRMTGCLLFHGCTQHRWGSVGPEQYL